MLLITVCMYKYLVAYCSSEIVHVRQACLLREVCVVLYYYLEYIENCKCRSLFLVLGLIINGRNTNNVMTHVYGKKYHIATVHCLIQQPEVGDDLLTQDYLAASLYHFNKSI